jgi:hypothetical protein
MKDIFGCDARPPFQGGKTTRRGFACPWVAGSDETGALDPACGTTTFRRSAADGYQTTHPNAPGLKTRLGYQTLATQPLWETDFGIQVKNLLNHSN